MIQILQVVIISYQVLHHLAYPMEESMQHDVYVSNMFDKHIHFF